MSPPKFLKGDKTNAVANFLQPAPFSDSRIAQQRRDAIVNFKPISLEDALSGNTSRPIRIYADGVFDVFHSGHARALMQAKTRFNNVYLIAGVSPDSEVHSLKGQTVNSESERYDAVTHCRYVDEVLRSCPWSLTLEFLDEMKIDFVAHDDIPYGSKSGAQDIYATVKNAGRFVATTRTEGISTSDLIHRIVRDYDHYIKRNLQRGYTRKDLNIGYLKEKRIRIRDKIARANIRRKNFVSDLENKRVAVLQKWEHNTKDFVVNFLERFGYTSARDIWNHSKNAVMRAISPSRDLFSPQPSPTSPGTD